MNYEEQETAHDAATSQAAKKENENLTAPIIPQTPAREKVESVFIRIPEAMEIMQCSRTTAQRCFVEINKRLKAQGCFTISGRCNRREFYKAIGLNPEGKL